MTTMKKKSVSVEAGPTRDTIHTIDGLDDISVDAKARLWFSQTEMDGIVRDCRRTVQMMQQDGGLSLLNDDDGGGDSNPTNGGGGVDTTTTTRGLEYCTAEGFDITSATSQETVRLVLAEQARQRKEDGMVDPTVLASLMSQTSRHRQRVSHLMGMKDARAVYGDDKKWMKTTAAAAAGTTSGTQSGSFSPKRERRGRVQRSGSLGTLEDRTRRRRGSRGAIDRSKILADAVAAASMSTRTNATFTISTGQI